MFEEATNSDTPTKRKRRPAGTPDPEAEVVALRAETLLESDRYVCEICKQGFQREQNLQMHRRRHKVAWKLVKRAESEEVRKRVFVCPEPSCLHHSPSHALGDLVGIKKHFRRKHSNHKQWLCDKCSKAYAVHSDFKAHLKTCGTRGHSCDCGRVFSRVESFIEHQDSCTVQAGDKMPAACSSSGEANLTRPPPPGLHVQATTAPANAMADEHSNYQDHYNNDNHNHNLELQLLPSTWLKLSIGGGSSREEASEQLRVAAADKAYADEARQQARKQVETAEMEFANAKRMRQEAQAELDKAHLLRDQATSTIMQITCHACNHHFHASESPPPSQQISLGITYLSSQGDGD